ncbi:MAG: phosphotransferase [Gammaproteobacteria bacterium]|jgi:Ser/Thr protein kinase RdoA (MazF antagonist)|nr:phosphotransferase [Gammaproteobacteria bacterium]MBT5202589.1 phosphotransferase [Gammaproteobacteria bacterium]MBT5602467.1 phosphotransferase [Gammaproteobacteria bacterium]MBT6245432.1 phosphotransferase [Gammaproteobacteria bacterium]
MVEPESLLEVAEASLKHWLLDAESIQVVSQSENIVFKVVTLDQRAYALRLHRPGYHTLQELESEQTWIHALDTFGLQVPRSLKSVQSSHFPAVDCGATTRYAGLINWFDGVPLIKLSEQRQALINPMAFLGETCARMHNQASQWQAPADFARPQLDIDGFFGCNPFWGKFWEVPDLTTKQKNQFLLIREKLITLLSQYGKPIDTFSMIHADMHEGNVMVSTDDFLLIDFDDAGFGWHQYDLAVVLFNHAESDSYESLKDTLIKSYRKTRDFSDEDFALLPYFILIRALVTVSWLHFRPEHHQPGLVANFISRALRMASRLSLI